MIVFISNGHSNFQPIRTREFYYLLLPIRFLKPMSSSPFVYKKCLSMLILIGSNKERVTLPRLSNMTNVVILSIVAILKKLHLFNTNI